MRVPALTIHRYGGPEVFEIREVDLPSPGPGQVRVAVRAAGINFAEVFCRLGLYKHAPPLPFVPGFEWAGEVVDGEGFAAGERVLGVSRFGGYQGGVLAEVARVREVPADWSFEEAAALPAAALTAGYGLWDLGRLARGEAVVIHSAAGGVGSTAVQLALATGARVIGTAGSDDKLPLLLEMGCHEARNYKRRDWARGLDGLDVIFDALGGPITRQGYDLLGPRGRLVCYGLGTMTPAGSRPNPLRLAWQYMRLPRFPLFSMISDNKSIAGFNVLLLWDEPDALMPLFDRCMTLAHEGRLRPRVSDAAPYEEVGRLHAGLQSGRTTGKLVLQFPG